jgi:hypothetical protein
VSGSITYKGSPLKAANMAFHTNDGTAYPGLVSSDGTYIANDLPAGDFVITVETESFKSAASTTGSGRFDAKYRKQQDSRQAPSDMPAATTVTEMVAQYTKIPSKYANPKTSPLSITLKPGRQVHAVEITD